MHDLTEARIRDYHWNADVEFVYEGDNYIVTAQRDNFRVFSKAGTMLGALFYESHQSIYRVMYPAEYDPNGRIYASRFLATVRDPFIGAQALWDQYPGDDFVEEQGVKYVVGAKANPGYL